MQEGQPKPQPLLLAGEVTVAMAFACENVSTDILQRVSFLTIVEQLNATSFPVTTPLLSIVFGFQRTVPGFLVQNRIEIVPPEGDPVAAQDIPDMAFQPDQMARRHVVVFQGVTWKAAGEYTVRFTSRKNTVASFPIRVNHVQLVAPPS